MVNNYPEYAAGVNFKKTDSNGVRHFYSAQVVADPANETVESKLIKDGVVIDEGGGGGSSDFSTAEVTIVGGENGLALSGGVEGTTNGYIFIKTDQYGDTGVTVAGAQAGSTITPKALLFKNLIEEIPHDFYAQFGVLDGAIDSVDGNCEFDEESGSVLIWGDCTITGSGGI